MEIKKGKDFMYMSIWSLEIFCHGLTWADEASSAIPPLFFFFLLFVIFYFCWFFLFHFYFGFDLQITCNSWECERQTDRGSSCEKFWNELIIKISFAFYYSIHSLGIYFFFFFFYQEISAVNGSKAEQDSIPNQLKVKKLR